MHPRTTKSYIELREQIQESFDFVYVVSQAVPCLKLQASLVSKGLLKTLPDPDYFKNPNPLDQISRQVKGYKGELSKYILLSSFSYFEAFVVKIINELLDFHGGAECVYMNSKKQTLRGITAQEANHRKHKMALSKTDPKDASKRMVATQKLQNENFVFPSMLFSPLGAKAIAQKLANIKSVDIPKLLEDGFNLGRI